MFHYTYFTALIIVLLILINNFKTNKNIIYLTGYLFIIIVYLLLHYILFSLESNFLIAVFYKHFYPIFYMPGAMLYLYIKKQTHTEPAFKKIDLIHFVPFVVAFINIFPYYFISFEEKLLLANEIILYSNFSKYGDFQILYPFTYSATIRLVLFFLYTFSSLIILVKRWKKGSKTKYVSTSKNLLNWLTFISISGVIFITCLYILTQNFYYFLQIEKQNINSNPFTILAGITFLTIPLVILFFPQVIYGIHFKQLDPSQLMKNSINDPGIVELAKRIKAYFDLEKPYKNVDFSLDDLSKALNEPKHLIYKSINTTLNTKFTDLRSTYRVEYAKNLLVKHQNDSVPLKEIWTKSGFSSKTNFFTTFKEETGVTPTEFIKNNLNKHFL